MIACIRGLWALSNSYGLIRRRVIYGEEGIGHVTWFKSAVSLRCKIIFGVWPVHRCLLEREEMILIVATTKRAPSLLKKILKSPASCRQSRPV